MGRTNHGHGNTKRKPAIVFDVDETALSNYTAIDADNFTFGTNSQQEAQNEIGTAIKPSLELFKLAQKKGIAGGHGAVAFKLPNPFYFLP